MTDTKSVLKPKIDDIDPEAAKVGTTITITGSHMGLVTGADFIDKNNNHLPSPTVVKDDNTVTTVVPNGMPLGDCNVTVTNPKDTSNKYPFGVLPS